MKYMRSCPLTGRYYLMRTLVAIRHQLDKSNPENKVRWCACELSPELWSFLFSYQGGAARNATNYGLTAFAVRTGGFCACSCQTLFVHSSILFSAERKKYAVCNSEPAAQTAHDQTQAWAVPVHA